MRHISEVKNGKACGCVCPSPNCSSPLIANQGAIKTHYFSHQTNTSCSGESALHLAAKQLLENLASEKAVLLLPKVHAEYSKVDMLGEIVEGSSVEHIRFELKDAKQEVRLSDSLIADVLSKSSTNEELAIEIFVTNSKDELGEGKYRYIQVNAIEIDLSGLSWNINRDDLKDAVLKTAPRRWLYCNKIAELYIKLKQDIDNEVDRINQSYLANLYDIAQLFSSNTNLPSLTWPSLVARRLQINSSDFIESRSPKVKCFNKVWVPFDYGFSGTAIVGDKKIVNVDVVLFVKGNNKKTIPKGKPTLFIGYDERKTADYNKFDLRWENVELWQQKLERIADNKMVQMQNVAFEKDQMIATFVQRFRAANDNVKMQMICQKLGLSPPKQESKHNYYWNTSWDVWKSTVWFYKIHNNEGYTISSWGIADDSWLESLFGFPIDNKASEARRKMAGSWLKKLYHLGILRRISWSEYEVENSKLENFVPWQYIRKL
nr:competence protein CoiA family protein [Shewanella gaetbuli]